MTELPARVIEEYRAADSDTVRSWSYGALTSTISADPTAWRENRGTLADPRIFGPLFDFESRAGAPLRDAYERLIGANRMALRDVLHECVRDVVRALLPAFLAAFEWDLAESEALAKGLALARRGERG